MARPRVCDADHWTICGGKPLVIFCIRPRRVPPIPLLINELQARFWLFDCPARQIEQESRPRFCPIALCAGRDTIMKYSPKLS